MVSFFTCVAVPLAETLTGAAAATVAALATLAAKHRPATKRTRAEDFAADPITSAPRHGRWVGPPGAREYDVDELAEDDLLADELFRQRPAQERARLIDAALRALRRR